MPSTPITPSIIAVTDGRERCVEGSPVMSEMSGRTAFAAAAAARQTAIEPRQRLR
jgi:hypothetical protein